MCQYEWLSAIGNYGLLVSVIAFCLIALWLLVTAIFWGERRRTALTAMAFLVIPLCTIPFAAVWAFVTAMAHQAHEPGAFTHGLSALLSLLALGTTIGCPLAVWIRAARAEGQGGSAPESKAMPLLLLMLIMLLGFGGVWVWRVSHPRFARANLPPAAYCGVWQTADNRTTLAIGNNGLFTYRSANARAGSTGSVVERTGNVEVQENYGRIMLRSSAGVEAWRVDWAPHVANGRAQMTLNGVRYTQKTTASDGLLSQQ